MVDVIHDATVATISGDSCADQARQAGGSGVRGPQGTQEGRQGDTQSAEATAELSPRHHW